MNLNCFNKDLGLTLLTLAISALTGAHALAVEPMRDIAYKAEGDDHESERCKLDLYLPKEAKEFPTLVWFHGGGLEEGSKEDEMTVAIAQHFASEGIAVAVPNYRLSPEATYPAYIRDAAAAVVWVHSKIADHGGDPTRLFVAGHSAGGYLAAMIAMDPAYLKALGREVSIIRGVLPVSGQMITHSTVRKERGIPPTTPVIDAAAPAFHVREETPPFLLICGSEDLPARAAENIYFTAALKAAGHQAAEYVEVEGRDHGTIVSQIPDKEDPVAMMILALLQNE